MCCGHDTPAAPGPADRRHEVWWLRVRWIGVPAPIRWWARLRYGVPVASWGDTCGCIARPREFADRLAWALWGPPLPIAA